MNKLGFVFVDEKDVSVLTDFYELTMCAGYFENQKREIATFDLFIRKLPPNRSYFVFAGLEQVLLFIKNMKFTEEQLEYLRTQKLREGFLDYLRKFKFSGEVLAVPEGTIVFPNEPLIRVTAPIIEAQIIETFLLNTVNLQTTISSKASRVSYSAKGRPVIEFGLRRTQGTDAGMKAARCSYIAGCNGTSNVLAGMKYGIPIFGTMAHSYIMFFDSEIEAFRAFTKVFPCNSTLLIDTYNDLEGAKNATIIAKELEKQGQRLGGVRLDSGDLMNLSKKVRAILDNAGLDYIKILASGDLDEYKLEQLLERGAEIDAFGVGTRMSTSSDRPYIDVVYKLSGRVENEVFTPTMKLSKGKVTLPGRKQVFRQTDKKERYSGDIIGLENEKINGKPLLIKMIENGKLIYGIPPLEEVRSYVSKELARFPDNLKKLKHASTYPVQLSPKLLDVKRQLSRQLKAMKKT